MSNGKPGTFYIVECLLNMHLYMLELMHKRYKCIVYNIKNISVNSKKIGIGNRRINQCTLGKVNRKRLCWCAGRSLKAPG